MSSPNPFIAYLEANAGQGDDPGQYIPDWGSTPPPAETGYTPDMRYGAHTPGGPTNLSNRATPGTVEETQGGQSLVRPGPQMRGTSNASGTEIANYIRAAATQRGIDPEVAIRVALGEGGVDEPAKMGVFKTGRSWWPYQLHYGGAGTPYAEWGNTAGMGNDFTERTGYQPGDPAAWKAATDFALDHARRYGWKAWYGRVHHNVGEWDGIPR